MQTRILVVACLGLFVGAAFAATQPAPLASHELMRSARTWEIHDRGDLARLALEKLVATRPDAADALVELGELHLRMQDMVAAERVLQQLNARFPGSAAAKTFAAEYRYATRDRLQLVSIQRLLQLDRVREARVELDRLFPDGAPGGILSIEYYRMLAAMPGTWQQVHEGLQRLAASHAGDPRYQLALARHLLRNEATALQGVTILDSLARRDDVRVKEIDALLRSGLADVDYRVPSSVVDGYLARNPDDADVRTALRTRTRAAEESRLVTSDALSRIDPGAQRRNLSKLRQALQAAESDRRAQSGLAMLQLLEGQVPSAAVPKDNVTLAALWANRSRVSRAASQLDLAAAQLEAAVALRTGEYESTIALATRLQALGEDDSSGELLADASRLGPRSTWLFETYVRWLIDHERVDEALALLEARPLDQRWTTQSRDGLRAIALDQRGQSNAAAGRIAEAISDYEAAIALVPLDPWGRYRLAGFYARQGERDRGRSVLDEGAARAPNDAQMRYAQGLYLASIDDYAGAVAAVESISPGQRSEGMTELHARASVEVARSKAMERKAVGDLDGARAALMAVKPLAQGNADRQRQLARAWMALGDFATAARELDEILTAAPGDKELRIARAELDLAADNPHAARDRLAALVGEWPDDADVRLSYVRALTETGETNLARLQLQSARELAAANDVELQLGIARRQLALGDYAQADATLRSVLAIAPQRADVLLLAGRAALQGREYDGAREYFAQAQSVGDESVLLQARQALHELELRRQSWMETGIEFRHKPGDEGISKFEAVLLPTSWLYARNYEERFVLRADGVTMDAGKLSASFDDAALLGTIQAAGPAAPRLHDNDAQSGLSLGIGYVTDTIRADIGTTPLGFLLTNIVGGVEWTPSWGPLDVGLGISRRAVTSSVLSYGGLRDPISGVEWGGVVQTGPYARLGLYRERYSISGSLSATELTGTRVPDNRYVGLRVSADRKILSRDEARAYVGVTVNYWSYDENLQNYTFGSGGYYSPKSYLSIALPVELQGQWRGWSYRLRASLSHSQSKIDRAAFYPNDPDLQSQAVLSPLPPGYDEPYFESDRSSGSLSMSAYAAVERQISHALVVGAKLDIDRADYYEPTTVMLYVRHIFGSSATPLSVPPRPARPYSDY